MNGDVSDMINYCPECGSKIDEKSKFCPECGKNIMDEKSEIKDINDIISTKQVANINRSKKWTKVVLVGLVCICIVSAILISANQLDLFSIKTNDLIGPAYSATINNFDIKDDSGRAVVQVDVSGNSDMEIVLIRDGSEVCSESIKKRQLDDGNELINLEICKNAYDTPKGGNYEIVIYNNDEVVTQKTFYRIGPSLKITYFNPSFEKYYSLKERIVNEIEISYENIGDLPAYVSQIYLNGVMDSSYKNVAEGSQYIAPGESTTLSGSTYLDATYYVKDMITVMLLDSQGNALNLYYSWNEE